MNKKNKKVTTSVTHECWKSLKFLACEKEVSLQKIMQQILEEKMAKKSKAEKEGLFDKK